MGKPARGFSLLETLIAMVLVGMAMTGLVIAFVGSSQFGVLARRQATAMALARSLSVQLQTADYADPRLANANAANDANWTDSAGALATDPVDLTSANGADVAIVTDKSLTVGNEWFNEYITVAPEVDTGVELGRNYAVIVTYRVANRWYRAVAIGFRYNPANVGVGLLPI